MIEGERRRPSRFGEQTMSDEIKRILGQRDMLRQAIEPLGGLLRHIEPIGDIYKQLGIGPATMAVFQHENERSKFLAGLMDMGAGARAHLDIERHRQLLQGPVEEARRLGVFDAQADIRQSIGATIEAQKAFESLFRLPKPSELGMIAHEAMAQAGLAHTLLGSEDGLQSAMAKMHSPWLQIENGFASSKALSDILAIGHGIANLRAFDQEFAVALRTGLGDWRDAWMPALEPLIDPVLRSSFYLEQGFDPNLTNFTSAAFDEGLRRAGLREEAEPTEVDDDQEDCFARSARAFDVLQRFEFAVRRIIVRVMHAAYGEEWMKRQLPNEMLDNWIARRDTAVNAGHAEQPLIDYADFTHYKQIIERTDNWKTVFRPVFGRPEDIRESFQRLFPIRIATMHSRLITQDDELLLVVETKRVLNAIAAK